MRLGRSILLSSLGSSTFASVFAAACAVWMLAAASWARAQAPAPADPAAASAGALRVFLDCPPCDVEFLRQNIQFVDYVRDRAVADLHVLVTNQFTGGGGRVWVVKFIGLGALLGQDRELSFAMPPATTDDDERKEFARILKLGLAGYAASTPAGPQLDVTWRRPAAAASQTTAAVDSWNFWVFRINLNGNVNGERASTSRSYRLNVSGNRTTDRWKIHIASNGNYNTNRYTVNEETTIKSLSESWNVNALVVKSLTPKWSLGSRAWLGHSSFSNNDRSITVAPGFEYDFFPYSESARRSLTLQYTAGVTNFKYRELTVFEKVRETVPNHQLLSTLALRQPWGSLRVQSALAQHLNRTDRYRATVFGSTEVRLFKGFSFNVFGEYEKIKDQISLPKGAATTEEVLLRVRQLATTYSYFVSFGITYSFGSIFNNVVNTRFGQ